jgi:succinate-semialdehyde dehydrogenase / glutarate-semialdehyde dehydrogenase
MEHFIDGAWAASSGAGRLPVHNPATGALLDSVPAGTAADADRAVAAAARAFPAWRRLPMARRVAIQKACAAAMRAHADELARTLTLELGRPLAGSRQEIERSAELLDYYAEEGLRLRGELPMVGEPDERVLVVKEPVGVVVAIAPFNYPVTLLTFKLGAALITGCTVVAKPAEDTPLTTLRLAALFSAAGLPPGAFNVVTGTGAELGQALVTHPTPRKVAFTGSSAAGKRIAALAAATAKRVTLEMGGQCPAILCDDADLETAIPALARHAFANSGQFCYRVNRIYAQRGVYDTVVSRLAAGAERLAVGDGLEPATQLGPLVNEKIFRTSERHVADALAKGARVVCGGARLTGGAYDGGFFFPPTVIADADHSMAIMTEETFGPVVGVMPVDDLEQAISLANDSPYGLAGYVFSRDTGRALRAAEALEAGSVWVNNIHRSYHLVPFGGMKESGIGREKSRHGLDEYLELKSIYLGL